MTLREWADYNVLYGPAMYQELRNKPVMGPIAHPILRGYIHGPADAQGKTMPVSAVYEMPDGKIVIHALPPPVEPYFLFRPTLTYLWGDSAKGHCYRLNFGRKELFITEAELELLKAAIPSWLNKLTVEGRTSGRVLT